MSAGSAPAPAPENGKVVMQPQEAAEILPPEEEEIVGSTVWDFLQTKTGEAITTKVLDIIQSVQKSTIEANSEQNKKQLENAAVAQRQNVEFQHSTWRFWMWFQGVTFVICIVVTAFLAWHDKLSSTASAVITTTLGFLFGRSTVKH